MSQIKQSHRVSVLVGAAAFFEGIFPFQLGKAAEVRICRIQNTSVLDCQCSYVGIHDEICLCLALKEHTLKDLPVTFCGIDQTNAGLVKPALDSLYGLFDSQWLFEYQPVRTDPISFFSTRN